MSRRSLAPSLLAVATLLLVASPARAASCNYVGASGGDWHVATNWSCLEVPDSGDSVSLTGSNGVAVLQATSAGSLSMSGGATITLSGGFALTVSNGFTLSSAGGSLSGNGTVTVGGALSNAGTVLGVNDGARLVLNGPSSVSGPSGGVGGASGGVINLNGSGVADPHLELNDTLRVDDGGRITGGGESSLMTVNAANGEIRHGGAADSSISVAFVNHGLVRVEAGTLALTGGLAGTPAHDGLFRMATASTTLEIGQPFSLAADGDIGGPGRVRLASGATTIADGAVFAPGSLIGAGGTLDLQGSGPAVVIPSVTMGGGSTRRGARPWSIGQLTINGATFGDAHTTTVTGGYSAAGGQLVVRDGARLVLDAPATVSGPSGGVGGASGGVISLDGFGVADPHLEVNDTLRLDNGGRVEGNGESVLMTVNAPDGEIRHGGAADSTIGVAFVNHTLVAVEQGTLALTGGLVGAPAHDGDFSVPGTATLQIGQPLSLSATGSIAGAGTVRLQSSTTTIANGAVFAPAELIGAGGTLDLQGSAPAVTIPAVTLGAGTRLGARPWTIGQLTITGAATFSGAHTTTVTAGFSAASTALSLTLGARLVLNAPGTVSGPSGGVGGASGGVIGLDGFSGADPHLVLNDTLRLDNGGRISGSGESVLMTINAPDGAILHGGAAESSIGVPFVNHTRIDVEQGILSLSGGLAGTPAHEGAFNVASAAELQISQTLSLTAAGSIAGAGSVRLGSGVTTIPAGATFSPAALIGTGGTLDMQGSGPAVAIPTVTMSAGARRGTRPWTIGQLTITSSATFGGAHTSTVTGGFSAAGTVLVLTDGARLVLDAPATVSGPSGGVGGASGGLIVLDGSGVPDPHLEINDTLLLDNGGRIGGGGESPLITINAPNGRIVHPGGAPSSISAEHVNHGLIDVRGDLALSSLRNDGGELRVARNAIARLSNPATMSAGVVRVSPGSSLVGAAMALSGGRMEVDGTATTPVQLDGGVLAGIGQVDAAVTNAAGTVAPGRPLGTLTVASYDQGAAGTLEAEIEGDGVICAGSDTLAVAGAIALAGTLAIRHDPSFAPADGAEFLAVSGDADASGQFTTVTGATLEDGRTYEQEYRQDGVALVVTPAAAGLSATVADAGSAPSAAALLAGDQPLLAPALPSPSSDACPSGPVRVRIALPAGTTRARIRVDGGSWRGVRPRMLRRGVMLALDRRRRHVIRVAVRAPGSGRSVIRREIPPCANAVRGL